MTAVPPEAITAAARTIAARQKWAMTDHLKALALEMLEAAAPVILRDVGARVRAEIVDEVTAITTETVLAAVAAERERIRQLAQDWYGPGFAGKVAEMLSSLGSADLIGGGQ